MFRGVGSFLRARLWVTPLRPIPIGKANRENGNNSVPRRKMNSRIEILPRNFLRFAQSKCAGHRMGMNFEAQERGVISRLADVLIPAGENFPSASEAGVGERGLDEVLRCRPELLEPLKQIVANASGRKPREFLDELKRNDPLTFDLFADFAGGAYFLNAGVREKLGYGGQTARAIDPRPDYLDDGLLQSVIDRGPIYRPTPE